MTLVATLISNPQTRALTPSAANMASQALGASGVNWLAEEIACDIPLPDGLEAEAADQRLREVLDGRPIDIAVHSAEGRRKKMLIADMDSTMIDQECIDELADEIGIKEHVAAITARAMNGEVDFEPALRERVALLEDLETAVIERVIENRISLAAGGRTLLATMNADGAYTALVSGGFDLFTGRIAANLGFHEHRANRLMERAGRLTGKVAEPILGRQAKADALTEIAERLRLEHSEIIAVGDGANDLSMLHLAGMGVALHAKPSVAAEASIRIDHGDLTALLYLQGYAKAEFAE
ncbi:phosphoserine phosphatase SerB [Chelativorans sp. YIM 93263]|uniref:phosphoserine phosphatase SerB n=1 Tax=Chelativorans sp. YIM 93263 TaxID=2906648 RepID=UPI002378DB0F|nr:phosphoserine phosphatase SerB [Chelativorans sp. YIM 93263]